MMDTPLYKYLKKFCHASKPVNPEIFEKIPFFLDIFDMKLWTPLVNLSGESGIAYIEEKEIRPGDKIIEKGEFDMMVYWILEGEVDVVIPIKDKPTIVKRYCEIGQCFGEIGIIYGSDRISDVIASPKAGVTLLEIDWSITELCRELNSLFTKLLLKTTAKKLEDSYKISNNALTLIKMMKNESALQHEEIDRLHKILKENHMPFV